jgi:hypothetical protein
MMEEYYIHKFKDFMQDQFGSDPQKAWDHYKNAEGVMGQPEIIQILRDAGIGGFIISPQFIAGQVLKELDKPNNGYVTLDEVQAYIAANLQPSNE